MKWEKLSMAQNTKNSLNLPPEGDFEANSYIWATYEQKPGLARLHPFSVCPVIAVIIFYPFHFR